mmetsp:Transcript_114801/g.161234  ORF Transcript_114801/g.161234 Transcript_114801/m.161234 type:complete len:270 (+) Transcript_114801:72-881(+)
MRWLRSFVHWQLGVRESFQKWRLGERVAQCHLVDWNTSVAAETVPLNQSDLSHCLHSSAKFAFGQMNVGLVAPGHLVRQVVGPTFWCLWTGIRVDAPLPLAPLGVVAGPSDDPRQVQKAGHLVRGLRAEPQPVHQAICFQVQRARVIEFLRGIPPAADFKEASTLRSKLLAVDGVYSVPRRVLGTEILKAESDSLQRLPLVHEACIALVPGGSPPPSTLKLIAAGHKRLIHLIRSNAKLGTRLQTAHESIRRCGEQGESPDGSQHGQYT